MSFMRPATVGFDHLTENLTASAEWPAETSITPRVDEIDSVLLDSADSRDSGWVQSTFMGLLP